MRTILILLFFLFNQALSFGQTSRLLFKTTFGEVKVVLYDFTPKHRELILTAIKEGTYASSFFNRIIYDFVVQGGEHDIDIEKRESADPLGVKPRLNPEFDERAFHKVGALGAGRDGNPMKASFLNQLYFVVGKSVSAEELDKLELKKGIKYTAGQREYYLKYGGQPRLDGDYTVFGEVCEGLDVLLKISKVKTDSLDYPIEPIKFTLTVLE
ncbi:peptidylprolyl isomerase [Sphingobacterium tabacisoli]|uniref:peptidylprolyl isomerase n=1 Tax=Sphingobacterium tabacisoli TaxID=2044855 RepID=A0ABW5L681_9SPHI|nr:peptidylprolyl isomerase [Sphingobacterium tabacisoli]